MLTRAGVLVLVGSAATLLAARLLALTELFLLGATGVAVVILALVAVRLRPVHVEARRSIHPARVAHGGTSRVDLEIRNTGRRSSPVVTLHDPVSGTIGATVAVAPLRRADHQAASYRLPTTRRGLVHIGPLSGVLIDPFGLARRRFDIAGRLSLTVLPALEPVSEQGPGIGRDDPVSGRINPVPGATADEDFAALRPYVVGDDLRRVHWGATAHTDDLVVREDDPPSQGRQTLVLDGRAFTARDPDEDRLDPRFERAVSIAASILDAAARRGDRTRLLMTDGTDSGLVEARSGRALLLEHLALVGPHPDGRLPGPHPGSGTRTGRWTVVAGGLDAELVALVTGQARTVASVTVILLGDDDHPSDHQLPRRVRIFRVRPDESLAEALDAGRRDLEPA